MSPIEKLARTVLAKDNLHANAPIIFALCTLGLLAALGTIFISQQDDAWNDVAKAMSQWDKLTVDLTQSIRADAKTEMQELDIDKRYLDLLTRLLERNQARLEDFERRIDRIELRLDAMKTSGKGLKRGYKKSAPTASEISDRGIRALDVHDSPTVASFRN